MFREGKSGDWIGTFEGHKGAVWCARLSKDATRAATASADFTAKLWNAVTGDELVTFPHKHVVKACCFSLDEKSVITGGNEKVLRIHDIERPDSPDSVQTQEQISSVVQTLNPNILLTGTGETEIRVWDKRNLQPVQSLTLNAKLTGLSLSVDRAVITSTAGNQVQLWDSESLKLLQTFDLQQQIDCAAYHPKTKRFATGSRSELWVRAYDAESGKEVACNKGHHGPVRCLAFNHTGESYASGSEDGTIRIWDWARTGSKSQQVL